MMAWIQRVCMVYILFVRQNCRSHQQDALELQWPMHKHHAHPAPKVVQTCRMCSMPGNGDHNGRPYDPAEGRPARCLKVLPCDVAGQYKLQHDWTCARDARRPATGWQPPFFSFELRHSSVAKDADERVQKRVEEHSAHSMMHADYVLALNQKEVPLKAACWAGGERGAGCAAFPARAPCLRNRTSLCMLFEDALPVGDVVLMFDWERPAGAACNLQPDRDLGWRKELNGLGVWGRRAGAFFDDARVAVLSELTFYETQVRFKQQCPDLVHALWAKMNVRYDMLAFDGSPASVELNNLGTGDVRAALEVRRRKVDRLARVDFVKYGFSSVAEMQMFAAFLPTFPRGISVDMLRLFNTSSWMTVVALAQECYRTTGIKLISVTRDTHRETIASPGILVYDAHTNGTIKPVKNWPRAYVAVNSKLSGRLDPNLCLAMSRPSFTQDSDCHVESVRRGKVLGSKAANGGSLPVVEYVDDQEFGTWKVVGLLGLMMSVMASFLTCEYALAQGRKYLQQLRDGQHPSFTSIPPDPKMLRPNIARMMERPPKENLLKMDGVYLVGSRESDINQNDVRPASHEATRRRDVDSFSNTNNQTGTGSKIAPPGNPRPHWHTGVAVSDGEPSKSEHPIAAPRRQPQLHRVVFDGKVRMLTDDGIDGLDRLAEQKTRKFGSCD